MNRFLRKTHFTTKGGEEIQFKERKVSSRFDLLNIVFTPNELLSINKVGYFYKNGTEMRLQLNESAIQWNPKFPQVFKNIMFFLHVFFSY